MQNLIARQERFLHFPSTHGGGVTIRQESAGIVSPLEFFTHPEIVDELKLDDKNVKAIEGHFKTAFQEELAGPKISETGQSDSQDLRSPRTSDEPGNSTDAIQKRLHKFFDNANSILSDTERHRLKQLQLQFLLYRNGPLRFLRTAAISKEFGLSHIPTGKLKRLQKRLSKSLLQTEQKLVSEALNIWLKNLDKQQRELFDRNWKHALEKPGSLGRLVCYLQSDASFDAKDLESTDELQLVWKRPFFRHSANGNAELQRRLRKNVGVESPAVSVGNSNADDVSELSRLYALQHLYLSGFIGKMVELIPTQSLEIVEINREFEKEKREVVLVLAGELDVPIKNIVQMKQSDGTFKELLIYDWPDDMSLVEAKQEERLGDVAKQTFDRLLKVLLPHQLKLLKQTVSGLQIRSHGPMADLKFGELKEELELSTKDIEKLEKAANEAAEYLSKESLLARDNAIESILKGLDPQDYQKVKRRLGAPNSAGHCDLATLAIALSMSD
ncbi:hypothetical protein [Mariniblastus fucicola]|uniref:hypothetical protein n=1 Tax=Mariniblastus fucicola TaxID=980251 RepID=UPI0011DF495B|nr:hypothetical protein [Mariniblastus fucicola]